MNGWIIYNGALRMNKVEKLVIKLSNEAKNKGINIKLIKNNELLPMFDNFGNADLKAFVDLDRPDFIVFWDKDIILARHLELMGFKLFNSRESIQVCDNKALMQIKLSNSGIRMPKTIIGPFVFHQQKLDEKYAKKVFEELGNEVIVKQSYGSFGMQVYKVNSVEEFLLKIKEIGNNEFIVQENIHSSCGRDIRVNIIGNEIVGAMERRNSQDFRANITLGGEGKLVEVTDEQRDIALRAHNTLKLDFSGVDLLFGPDGEPVLCEINSNVNYLSYEEVSGINFSEKLLNYIMKAV